MAVNLVFIGLGSNLGDRESMLHTAAALMPPQIIPIAFSRIYETPPWGYADQPPFLNQVIKAQTKLTPQETLKELKKIEEDMGREHNFRYGPRIIDLDILFFNDEIIEEEGLSIPHPALVVRAFVLVPLLDIAPDLIHPVQLRSIWELTGVLEAKDIHVYERMDSEDLEK